MFALTPQAPTIWLRTAAAMARKCQRSSLRDPGIERGKRSRCRLTFYLWTSHAILYKCYLFNLSSRGECCTTVQESRWQSGFDFRTVRCNLQCTKLWFSACVLPLGQSILTTCCYLLIYQWLGSLLLRRLTMVMLIQHRPSGTVECWTCKRTVSEEKKHSLFAW